MQYISLNDLFLVGLALDISGAVLLAKGLLLSPRSLARLNTVWGINKGAYEDRCRNRVAGEFGVSYLTAGFVLQAAGYVLEIGGIEDNVGTKRLLAALGMAIVAVAIAWVAWIFLHRPRIASLETQIEAEREAAGREIEEEEG